MDQENLSVVEEATEVCNNVSKFQMTNQQKVGALVAAGVLTGGIAVGLYFLIRHLNAKKASKPVADSDETNTDSKESAN